MEPPIFKSDEVDNSSNLDNEFIGRADIALVKLPLLNHFERADVVLMEMQIHNHVQGEKEDM